MKSGIEAKAWFLNFLINTYKTALTKQVFPKLCNPEGFIFKLYSPFLEIVGFNVRI